MANLFDRLLSSVEKRARYRRTVDALRNLPLHLALDLDLYSGDAEKIARRVVYGN